MNFAWRSFPADGQSQGSHPENRTETAHRKALRNQNKPRPFCALISADPRRMLLPFLRSTARKQVWHGLCVGVSSSISFHLQRFTDPQSYGKIDFTFMFQFLILEFWNFRSDSFQILENIIRTCIANVPNVTSRMRTLLKIKKRRFPRIDQKTSFAFWSNLYIVFKYHFLFSVCRLRSITMSALRRIIKASTVTKQRYDFIFKWALAVARVRRNIHISNW